MTKQIPNAFQRLLNAGFEEGIDARRERLGRLDRQAAAEQVAAVDRARKAKEKIEAAHRRWKARDDQR